jgi:hypothetical protein
MTSHKLYVLVSKFEDAIIGRFGKREPVQNPTYTGVFTPEVQESDIAHLLWMAKEMKDMIQKDRIPKAMRWLGFIQHATLSLGLADLEGIKEMSRDQDETNFPPPAGMNTMAAKVHVIILTPLGVLSVLVRQTWLPCSLQPQFLKFPNIDPDGRLNVLGDLGVRLQWEVASREWDYTDCSLNLYLRPTVVGLHLCEESVALVMALYRQAGWEYKDDEARKWAERLEEYKKQAGMGHSPDCPHHPQHPQHPYTAQQPSSGPMYPSNMMPGMVPPGLAGMPVVFGPFQGPPPGAVPMSPAALFGHLMGGAPGFDPTVGSYEIEDEDDDEEEVPPKKRKKRRKPKPENDEDGPQTQQ